MDRPPIRVEEAAESVNPCDQGVAASEPFEYTEPTEALLIISQDMARVLDRLTALKLR